MTLTKDTAGRSAPASERGMGSRLPSLTGMRAVAGLSVFLTHIVALWHFADPVVQEGYTRYFSNAGLFGLAFFFVLTGFVVTWSARPGDTATGFWRRRFFKIYPNHVVAFAILLVLFAIAGDEIRPLETVTALFLLQAWIPDADFLIYSVNGPTWTLTVDVLAYASFPLLFLLIKRIRPNLLWFWAVVVTAVAVAVPWLGAAMLPDEPISPFSPGVSWPEHWFAFYFPLARALEFVLGMLMARIVLTGRWIGLGAIPATVLTLAVYVGTVDIAIFDGYTFIPLIPIALLIPALARSDVNGRRTGVNSRPMVWLGERMYSFYILHITVLFSVHALFVGEWGASGYYTRQQFSTVTGILFIVGLYVLCLLLASILYAVVERPMMRRWSVSRARSTTAR
jgi:peptidoglycan/LPS O-acetylase OafA/YrhL